MKTHRNKKRVPLRCLGTVVIFVAACSSESSDAANGALPKGDAVFISPDQVAVVALERIESGPRLSGNLTAEREAQLRAEVSGSIVQVLAEPGQAVQSGQLLARLDDAGLREQMLSARSAVRSAEQSAQLADRNTERAKRLTEAGAIAMRDLEAARVGASSAQAQLTDAAARLALAMEQLDHTRIVAPFSGVIGQRPVSGGDVVSPGILLFTVVDPLRMKLEAQVPAGQIASVRPGVPVEFTVQGYPGRVLRGFVRRVNPSADPQTRQVGVTASISNPGGQLPSGLFAEGRIGAQGKMALVLPVEAVDLRTSNPTVMRIRSGKVEQVSVRTGLRDDQSERIEITAGLAVNDTILLGAAQTVSPGTPVRVQAIDRRVR